MVAIHMHVSKHAFVFYKNRIYIGYIYIYTIMVFNVCLLYNLHLSNIFLTYYTHVEYIVS